MEELERQFEDLDHVMGLIKTQFKNVQEIEEEYYRTQSLDVKMKLARARDDLNELFIRYDKRKEEIEKSDSSTRKVDASDKVVPIAPEFIFANRETELSQLTETASTANFFLLEGPAGQGKTYLLKQVIKKFENPKVRTLYINFREQQLIDENQFLRQLLEMLDYQKTSMLPGSLNNVQLLRKLISYCNDMSWTLTVLLFDAVENLQEDRTTWLREEVIYKLASLVDPNRIRVVIAGRYIAGANQWQQGNGVHFWKSPPMVLSEFSPRVIVGVIGHYARGKNLPLQNSLQVQNILAYEIYRIAGGHPEFIINVLKHIQGEGILSMNPDVAYCQEYFREESTRIFREVVRPHIGKLFADLHDKAEQMQRAFETLSIFRYFTVTTLAVLIKRNFVQGFATEEELLERLTRTRLITMANDAALYHDNIIRNVMSNFMRLERRKVFEELNLLAINIYENWINGRQIDPLKKMRTPPQGEYQVKLVLEWIYHKLVLLELDGSDKSRDQQFYDSNMENFRRIVADAAKFLNWSDLESSQGSERFLISLQQDSDITLMVRALTSPDGYSGVRQSFGKAIETAVTQPPFPSSAASQSGIK